MSVLSTLPEVAKRLALFGVGTEQIPVLVLTELPGLKKRDIYDLSHSNGWFVWMKLGARRLILTH